MECGPCDPQVFAGLPTQNSLGFTEIIYVELRVVEL